MSRPSNTLRATSPGKLNLTFDILGDLAGGYHRVETLMQAVDIYDELVFSFERADEFTVEIIDVEFAGAKADVPMNQNNLIAKAACLFKKHSSVALDYKISVRLHKAVPVAGGMGGGSGNAAATLLVLNQWFNSPFSANEIKDQAAQIGADVPFFIEGGMQLGTHRGDVLTKVDCLQELNFLIVGPKLYGMQTAEIYSAYDNAVRKQQQMDTHLSAAVCASLLQVPESKKEASQKFGNVFEPIVYSHRPELQFIQSRLTALGGLCTHLTGSGPTLYVFTDSSEDAKSIQKRLTDEQMQGQNGWNEHPNLTLNTWIAKSVNRGVLITAD
jgi:4-diphosphocytidyl-2-C-methyl-D-erythritol kinase